MYIYIYICVCVCVWRERERERERGGVTKAKEPYLSCVATFGEEEMD